MKSNPIETSLPKIGGIAEGSKERAILQHLQDYRRSRTPQGQCIETGRRREEIRRR